MVNTFGELVLGTRMTCIPSQQQVVSLQPVVAPWDCFLSCVLGLMFG